MDEEQKKEYDFCPKCGAVMYNGQCQSCGYGKKMNTEEDGMKGDREPEYRRKKKGLSSGAKVIIFICLFLICCMLGLVGAIIFLTVRNFSSLTLQPEISQDFYDYNSSFGAYNPYIPDAGDEYYKELVDATNDDLGYQVEWHQETAYPDDSDENAYLSLYYPTFSGDHEELLESINGKVREMIHRYDGSYTEDGAVVSTVVYVTLMEEDRLSLVCKYEVSGKNDYYGLDALNMDMTTGTEIPNSTLLEVDDTLVTRFRVQNSKQNGSITWLDDMSDEELLEILSDDEKRVVFLTPVGTEVGVNTDDGWVTVTFKENAL